jgi:hypothetical protein
MQTEIQSLQNAANDLGIVIHQKQYQDKRQKIKKYFAQIGVATVSPVLDYENMNRFLLGWRNCLKQLNNL